mgnify:CR=1 FL=1
MKKLLLALIVALIPSMIFATTTTATIGGTLKVYETLSLAKRDMVWPAQYAGTLGSIIFTNSGQPAASGITGTSTIGQAGSVTVTGTGGTQFTPSLGAFTFTAGPSNLTALNTATTVKLCAAEPMSGAAECTGVGLQTLPNSGVAGQNLQLFVQGKIASGVTLVAGTHTGTVLFTATY